MKRLHPIGCGLLTALILGLGLSGSAGAAPVPSFYRSGSMAHIAQARQGRPFVVVLWSLECSVCVRELDFLAQTLRDEPDMDMVLISTDGLARSGDVSAALAAHGLTGAEWWIFAESDAQRLRFEIDSSWYGELPRAYFYDALHRRTAVSGALEKRHFDAWRAAGGTGGKSDDVPVVGRSRGGGNRTTNLLTH